VLATAGGIGADLIIEGTGNPEAIPEGLALLRACGKYIWAGQYSDRGMIPLPTHLITFNALQIIGSAQFSTDDRVRYFAFLETVPEQWDNICAAITDRFPITEANAAFEKARCGAAVKTLFVGEG
jgi:threonine dehydrogenase-like Zn-dependent dehydrogenase